MEDKRNHKIYHYNKNDVYDLTNIKEDNDMKTISKWLTELPETQKTKAFRNVELQGRFDYCSFEECESLKSALVFAFIWGTSKEGEEYWREFYSNLK